MKNKPPGFNELGFNESAPRGIEPSPATPGPTERELGVIAFKGTKTGGELQSPADEPRDVRREGSDVDLGVTAADGWVAGIPIIGGVGEYTVVGVNGVQVRMAVRVGDNRAQVEWLKSRLFGGDADEGGETA